MTRRCACGAPVRGRVVSEQLEATDVAQVEPIESGSKAERRKWRPGWSQQVVEILHARPELRGVSDEADALDQAVRWSA